MTKLRTLPRASVSCLALAISASAAMADPATYAGPQDALDAFVTALDTHDVEALLTVFGPEARDLLTTGNPVEDAENRAVLQIMYAEGYRFQPEDDDSVTLLLGADAWPFPVPLVKQDGSWHFDVVAGRDEITDRDIGLNELDVIDLLTAYVDVQANYRLSDHNGDGVLEFASTILSTEPGTRDGLFWAVPDSPVGAQLARASFDGYSDGSADYEPEPLMGYYFRVLHGQGDLAPGGALDYIINGHQLAGHAILAVPADYDATGVHTFMVAENGIILQADLGEDTLTVARDITLYNPDDAWTPVDVMTLGETETLGQALGQ
ncbi:DUF2950 family protein [Pseudoruegeria sp. SK021]|uniref:DUF2950 family protein n=1 Tax=Pseudoruegeria sp. SK021 TaxID=1933035 RepID=UPI000A23AB8F|nr:DUF2950 family protein [Pseudoruegeria sp. SK021]OSP54252.1 hypothetical protein BV911_13410 [Pseudoruegeria sp. SK021]